MFSAVSASYLGTYKAGNTVTYSVVCVTNEGAKDTGCSSPDDDILDPDDTSEKSPTSALAEVSDANFPGLWRGSYLIPNSPLFGTWSIYIELTNSNSTTAATVLHFDVVEFIYNQTVITDNLNDNFTWINSSLGDILADTDDLQTNQNWDVWDDPARNLTYYPPTRAIISLDLTRAGLINSTFYHVGSSHILTDDDPDNDGSFATYYYKKYSFDIGYVPSNVTNGYIIYWLKKKGTPTGDLLIQVENLVHTIDVTTLSTSYTQFITRFDKGNITDSFVEIQFNGSVDWSPANDVLLGASVQPAIYSLDSTDGESWIHPTYEYTIGLIVEYDQKAIASQLNEESVFRDGADPKAVCPEQTLFGIIEFFDFQGNQLDITTLPTCTLCKIEDNGTVIDLGTENIDVFETDYHQLWVSKNGTYTEDLENNGIYKFLCEGTVLTTAGGSSVTSSAQSLLFKTRSEIECNTTKISEDVWGFNVRELTDYNQTEQWTFFRELNSTVYSINNTMAQQVWEYTTRTLTSFGTLVADIWGYVTRTLSSFGSLVTDVDTQLNTSHPGNWSALPNGTGIAEDVWKYNVTGMTNTTAGGQLNQIFNRVSSSFTALVNEIWSYSYRYIHGQET